MRALFLHERGTNGVGGVLRLNKNAAGRCIYCARRWRLLTLTAFHVCRLCPVRPGGDGFGGDGGGAVGSVDSRGDQLKRESAKAGSEVSR
jgi:hypothetical protein